MKRLLIIAIVVLTGTLAFSKDIKRPNSYNYQRGCEAVENNNYEEAMRFLQEELRENPKNGYAWAWILAVKLHTEEYGNAVTAGQEALKYIPKKDHYYIGYVHKSLANAFYALEEVNNALSEISEAIKADPEELEYIAMRAELYYKKKLHELADKDFETIIRKAPGKSLGYMGLGRNLLEQKRYDEAIAKFTYVTKLEEDFSQPYAFRADCHIGKGDNLAAAKDLVKAFDMDGNSRAFATMQFCNDTCYQHLVVLLNVKCAQNSMDKDWHYVLGAVHQKHSHYADAIKKYKQSLLSEPFSATYENISECYGELGNYPMAHHYIDMAIEMDSTDTDLLRDKADYYYYSGDVNKAIDYITKYITAAPEMYFGYYRRAFYKDNTRDVEGAITDYTYCITLAPHYAYAYLGRGDMYMLQGETEKARKDYEMVIKLDTIIGNQGNCRQYAFLMLDMRDSAKIYMEKILEKFPNGGNYYDAACLMARMGETDRSISYLELAFENGYYELNHLESDDDLDMIRNDKRYKMLIEKQKKIIQERNAGETISLDNVSSKELQTTEIPFKKDGSMIKVSCTINSLPLHFILDTGASDVSISNVEADFMMKNGYLNKNDIIGKAQYQMADGHISEGTVINLRRVVFGELELTDIKASVVNNQQAPLLLGQSILRKLGKIEIDNEDKVIKVTHLSE